MRKYSLTIQIILLLIMGCASQPGTDHELSGMETLSGGDFYEFESGTLYLPRGWMTNPDETYPAAVLLHGLGAGHRSMAQNPVFSRIADSQGMVLFFPRSKGRGWLEHHDSEDFQRLTRILQIFAQSPWLQPEGLTLFGWSAGAVMASNYLTRNHLPRTHRPLINRLILFSGFTGYQLEKDLRPGAKNVRSYPGELVLLWGDRESKFEPLALGAMAEQWGWKIQTQTHPGAHWLDASLVEGFLTNSRATTRPNSNPTK